MRTTLIFILLSLLTSCNNGPDHNNNVISGVVSIAHLKSLCANRLAEIHSDISICGTVIANDQFGELYKSFIIADDTGGVQVALDKLNLYRQIPLFSRVEIFCNGMTLGRVGGKVTLGAYPTGEFIVDNISEEMLNRYIKVYGTAEQEPVRKRKICDIGIHDISTLVQLDGVHVTDRGCGTWCETKDGEYIDTSREIEDEQGNRLQLRIRGLCHYAGEPIPSGVMTLKGIIDYAGGEYYLRIANHSIVEQ